MVPWDTIINATNDLFNRFEQNQQNSLNRNLTREMWDKQVEFGREQMAAQRKQFDDQLAENRFLAQQSRDWQLEDIKSDRAWNSASSVVERLRAAGINPYLAMNSGAAGQMAGSGSGNPAAMSHSVPTGGSYAVGLPHGQVDVNRAYVSPPFSSISRERQVDADITRSRVLNWIDASKAMASIYNSNMDARYKKLLGDDLIRTIREGDESWEDRKLAYKKANQKIDSDISLQTALGNLYDQSSLEMLTRAGLNRAQANEIVKLTNYKIKVLVSQADVYESEARWNDAKRKIDEWWTKPNFYLSETLGKRSALNPLDISSEVGIHKDIGQTVLAIKEAAHYENMTRIQKEEFDDWINYWLHPVVTGMSYGTPYAVERGLSAGHVAEDYNETVVKDNKGKVTKTKSHTWKRKKMPIKGR